MIRFVDIEIYDTSKDSWAQGRYLVHGADDIFWTDNIDDAISFLKDSLKPKYD
ncbi:MAG: hypothetical protein JRJ00_14770 [Deltaproteobacteria bacterium]|nr:hypothetical protein [Deltaproteobacteria bacterium]